MAQFVVSGALPAYGVQPGETVTLDASEPGVRVNVAAGVITLVKGQPDPKMTCPACKEAGTPKRPPNFASSEELAAHYGEKHPALVAPEWEEEA